MNFKEMYSFLGDLEQNNSKDWMDKHRKRYKAVRDSYIKWLDKMDHTLAGMDDEYYATPGKKGINRINNNLMFHPNKPIYKDHFGAGLDKAPNTGDFYVQFGLERNMFAGGFWRPGPKTLRSIRDAIDYDGEVLKEILDKESFKDTFGDLVEDNHLVKAPKGFSMDHPHIDLLQLKTFAVMHIFPNEVVFLDTFEDHLIQVYKEMLPFRRYLNKAVTV